MVENTPHAVVENGPERCDRRAVARQLERIRGEAVEQ